MRIWTSEKRREMSEKRSGEEYDMQIDKQSMVELAETVAGAVVTALEQKGLVGKVEKPKPVEKSAYAKTEALLYNYNAFKRIVQEAEQEIEDIRKYGAPRSCAVTERVQGGTVQKGLTLPEETVDAAVRSVQASVERTVHALALIEKGMASLHRDPYYKLLELRYIEGRTQEDIAAYFGVSQVTISNNKNRLVRELALRIFPNQVVNEMLN